MKKTNCYLLLMLLPLWALCQEQQIQETIIAGQFKNSKGDSLALVSLENFVPYHSFVNPLVQVQADAKGNFCFRFHLEEPSYLQVLKKDAFLILPHDLYIEPGDSLVITYAYDDGLLIEGRGSKKLSCLVEDANNFSKSNVFEQIQAGKFQEPASFKRYADSIYRERRQRLNAHEPLAEPVRRMMEYTLLAQHAYFLLNYLEIASYYDEDGFEQAGYTYPNTPDYYDFLEKLPLNDRDFCLLTAAKSLAPVYLENRLQEKFKTDTSFSYMEADDELIHFLQAEDTFFKDNLIIALLQEASLRFFVKGNTFIDLLRRYEETFMPELTLPSYKQIFKQYAARYYRLTPGNPAPDFALPDTGNRIHRLSDYKGKVVYLEFWGTWCGPCLQQIPYAIKLQEKYKNQPVVFIYIALESSGKAGRAGWIRSVKGLDPTVQRFLQGKEWGGVHLLAEGQFTHPVTQEYMVRGVPMAVLIDHEGKIIMGSTPSPRYITDEIDQALARMKKQTGDAGKPGASVNGK